ncbi:hypothetical protein HHX48_16995 [Salinimonas sp. HHU 13199]|uniref:Uncharacterized protein n=1 Tax=Salinimonas profundi TaxID=2729140 RepID=A0ABR8LNX0_9ALTE|nr:hypothetical protein [Salinimonas profundi]MBD3587437.1 hypothetical protein [Salinimonas profundi]
MSNKTNTRDLNIRFIHQFKRSTRTEWPDRFRLCWFFDPDTLDYIYEHKNEHFITNGFVLSDALVKQLPEGFQKKYFEPHERCLLFLLFEIQIVNFINSDVVGSDEFENTFGVSKNRYFSTEAIDEWTEQIELL